MGCSFSKQAPAVAEDIPVAGNNNNHHSKSATTDNSYDKSTSLLNPRVDLMRIFTSTQLSDLAKKTDEVFEKGAFHLKNIFALPLDGDELRSYRPPSFSKTREERMFIESTLKNKYALTIEGLSDGELKPLVRAFEKTVIDAGTVLMKEGDEGDYAYLIYSGVVELTIKGKVVGEPLTAGTFFGELALLYTCPRAATATAKEQTCIFRVDQKSFRYVMQDQTEKAEKRKTELLQNVDFLKGLPSHELSKLADNMTAYPFRKGDVLGRKGDKVEYFWLLDEGEVKVQDRGSRGDYVVGPGGHAGEHAICAGERRLANFIAVSDGRAFRIDRETFEMVMGDINKLMKEAIDRQTLAELKLISEYQLDPIGIKALASFMQEATYKPGEYVLKEGEQTEAAFYIINKGQLELTSEGGRKETLIVYSHLGDEMMLLDAETGKNDYSDPTTVNAPYTVQVCGDSDCTVGILKLEDCRNVLDTTLLGKTREAFRDSIVDRKFSLQELDKHRIIGCGTFGQVWAVSRVTTAGQRRTYALKVQSKFELCKNGQARAVANEKKIMAQLHHPFLAELFGTSQDEGYIYMLMGLVQGGELERRIRIPGKMKEEEACFYAACIHEALTHMHHRGIIYRDLKSRNVLIKDDGYPLLIDFGFAKYVFDKTYTFCGTPFYLAPEIISDRGHNSAADHWSLGILTYEMLAGYTPFYKEGMDQMELFRAITRCRFDLPEGISNEAKSFLKLLIRREPTKRLGHLAGGYLDIYRHPWFKSMGIRFGKLRRLALIPPYIPEIQDSLDTRNFEDWSRVEDKLKTKYEPISSINKVAFENF